TEHRRICANPKGECQHRHHREARRFCKLAECVPEIVHEWISDYCLLIAKCASDFVIVLLFVIPASSFAQIHSIRSASMGSTRLARRAGKKQAISATNESVTRALMRAAGSNGATL